jgi:putative phosphoesterase
MTTKIGLISDVHAAAAPLQEALRVFGEEGVEAILCAGDIAGYGKELEQTVALLIKSGCRAIVGNHDLWHLGNAENANHFNGSAEAYLRSLYDTAELDFAGKTVYMVHASPPDSVLNGIKLLDEEGLLIRAQKADWSEFLAGIPYDVLVVGHTHQVFAEQLGDVLVINPGSTLFNHTCAILTLPDMEVRFIPLSGKKPLLSWNWGMLNGLGSRD